MLPLLPQLACTLAETLVKTYSGAATGVPFKRVAAQHSINRQP